MSAIVTLYLSMFRQNASGSNCGMITTGDPSIITKGSNKTPPRIGPLVQSLPAKREKNHDIPKMWKNGRIPSITSFPI